MLSAKEIDRVINKLLVALFFIAFGAITTCDICQELLGGMFALRLFPEHPYPPLLNISYFSAGAIGGYCGLNASCILLKRRKLVRKHLPQDAMSLGADFIWCLTYTIGFPFLWMFPSMPLAGLGYSLGLYFGSKTAAVLTIFGFALGFRVGWFAQSRLWNGEAFLDRARIEPEEAFTQDLKELRTVFLLPDGAKGGTE